MAAYPRTHKRVDASSFFVIIVLAALLGTAGLDIYAFGTFFNSFGSSPGHRSVVHLDRNTTHEVAKVNHDRRGAATGH